MLRRVTIIVFIIAFIVGALLFRTGQNVREAERDLHRLTVKIKEKKETLQVLRAEWNYLNSPDNLQRQVSKYLEMEPVDNVHIIKFKDIPDSLTPDRLPMPRPSLSSIEDVSEKEEWLYPVRYSSGGEE